MDREKRRRKQEGIEASDKERETAKIEVNQHNHEHRR